MRDVTNQLLPYFVAILEILNLDGLILIVEDDRVNEPLSWAFPERDSEFEIHVFSLVVLVFGLDNKAFLFT